MDNDQPTPTPSQDEFDSNVLAVYHELLEQAATLSDLQPLMKALELANRQEMLSNLIEAMNGIYKQVLIATPNDATTLQGVGCAVIELSTALASAFVNFAYAKLHIQDTARKS